ncbi:unnamed protein product [Staurois parvus]|uniref:Uncharacterized protein n=1 Tax=Staurois parvus TaxID=386267 RepID=A0ABN9AY61_9NEOB|nr:unnamed protein product [Staurois parvus]
MPHISTYQCTSMPHISANLSAHQCRLSVTYISAAFQCAPVMPVNAQQCHLSVPISSAYQCPSLQPHLAHISEGEKLLIYNIL